MIPASYVIWIVLIAWFMMLTFSYNYEEKILKVMASIIGIFLAIQFMLETNTALQYLGLLLFLTNSYILTSEMFRG